MATITLNELSSYNNGKLVCRTFNLTDEDTFNEEVNEWLAELTESTGQLCEEWIIGDSDGIPSNYLSDYSLSNEFWEWLNVDLPDDIKLAGIDCEIAVENIEEAYQGTYDSDEDFAQELAESIGAISGTEIWPHTCVDWEWAARELMYDYCESDGHYFRML